MRHVLNFNLRAGFWYVTCSLYRSNCLLPVYTFRKFMFLPCLLLSLIPPPASSMHWPVPRIFTVFFVPHAGDMMRTNRTKSLPSRNSHSTHRSTLCFSTSPALILSSWSPSGDGWRGYMGIPSPRAWVARCWFQRCCHLKFCLHADSPPSNFKTKSLKIVFCH